MFVKSNFCAPCSFLLFCFFFRRLLLNSRFLSSFHAAFVLLLPSRRCPPPPTSPAFEFLNLVCLPCEPLRAVGSFLVRQAASCLCRCPPGTRPPSPSKSSLDAVMDDGGGEDVLKAKGEVGLGCSLQNGASQTCWEAAKSFTAVPLMQNMKNISSTQ